MTRKKAARVKRESVRGQLQGANECLDMVRVALEQLGLQMRGTPPMFYDDAIDQLASILGRAAGMEKWIDIQRHVAEHEAARWQPEEIAPGNSGNVLADKELGGGAGTHP